MIKQFSIKNLAKIDSLKAEKLSKINVFVGENDSGKTIVLKSLYTVVKSLENFKKGNEKKTFKDIISEKIYWTFQVEKLGDLVKKDREIKSEHLEIQMKISEQDIFVTFSDSASKNVGAVSELVNTRNKNSIFIPAKEVLSLFPVIKNSRLNDNVFGFDDTYLDLVNALEKEPQKGQNYQKFAKSKKILNQLINGKIEYQNGQWIFRKNKMKIPIHTTAEGIKKIGIIDRLLSSRYIQPGSIIFIDEPESFLHPKAIIEFLDIINLLAKNDIQVFIATHSYFVINKLMLIAKQENLSIPIITLKDKSYDSDDLINGLPESTIVDTSIKLYEEELDLSL